MAQTVNERACVVDYLLWSFGREICSKKPRCETCNLACMQVLGTVKFAYLDTENTLGVVLELTQYD